MKKGKIVILSGPSGSGKTTLYRKILKSKKFRGKLIKSISVTTRPKRPGEKHGRDYFFVSQKMFLHKKRAGHFLENKKVFNNFYGTRTKKVKEALKQGKNMLLCIDVEGAKDVVRKHPEAVKIFVTVPSLNELKSRLKKRGTESAKSLKMRLEIAKREISEVKRYDYVVVNDSFAKAYKKLKQILSHELNLS